MHHLSWNIQVPLDVKLFCARYEYSCHLKTYQSVYQHQIPSMICMAYKPFFCERPIYIGGVETLFQKQQKATAKFERTDGIVGGREKADGTLTSTMAFMGLLAPHCCPTRQNLSCKWNSWKLKMNAKQKFDKDLQTLK